MTNKEFNKIIPELKIFLKDILENENLTETSQNDCVKFIDRLDSILKPPSLPPRSGRVSTTNNPSESLTPPSVDLQPSKDDTQNTLVSSEYLEQQRELSRKATLWKADDKPLLPPKPPTLSHINEKSASLEEPHKEEVRRETIYQRISVSDVNQQSHSGNVPASNVVGEKQPQGQVFPPPVPERTSRSTPKLPKSPSLTGVKIVDLPHPLFSGLLRNVGSNTKQWCVIKHKKLFLFNDLYESAAFVADLSKYEVIKDPSDMYVFHVKQHNEPSIILATVDEDQYELWYDAFKRAKSPSPDETEEKWYVSLAGVSDSDDVHDVHDAMDGGIEGYEKPEEIFNRTRSPEELYVAMGVGVSSPRPLSPPTYETMESIRKEFAKEYRTMDLPPTPGEIVVDDQAPPLPVRTRHGTLRKQQVQEETDSDVESLNGSVESLVEVKSDTEIDKSRERDLVGGSMYYTMEKNAHKGLKSSEVAFLRDLSATYCGILYQRRMLAVWQKRFCKLKNQSLLCYRTPDDPEPSLSLSLEDGYQLDRAEEAWRSFAFKIFKSNTEVYYFAAINNAEQMRWLNVLAKAIDKEKFNSTNKLDTGRKSQGSQDIEFVISSEESFGSCESLDGVGVEGQAREGDVDSENEEEKLKPLRSYKHLHPAKKARLKNRPRAESLEDPGAEMQGYLYKKLKNHWSKRWCSIKDEKFFAYKTTPKDRPDQAILLTYTALCTPDDSENLTNYYMFKLRYEGDVSSVYRSRRASELERWIECLKKYVGSTSEEPFPYINVPPSPRSSVEPSSEMTTVDGDSSVASNDISFKSAASPITPSSFLNNSDNLPPIVQRRRRQAPSWSETEIEDSYINGKLTELQLYNQSFRHIERFVIITKEKWLKVYEAINSTTPILVFSALDIDVKEENGADASILHLLLGNLQIELLLKAADRQESNAWKDVFEKVHYEDIDDDLIDDMLQRARSRSIENDNSKLGQTTASRTMPNLGKRKKMAREAKEREMLQKTKSLHPQPTVDSPTNTRRRGGKALSLIRSFTIDTLGRKAKNKSYELPKAPLKEEDIVLKETQHGIIKQVIEKDGEEFYEERFCRIRGKIFQCFYQETDLKPIFKIPLKNAAIEEFANPGTAFYRFTITALDTGSEYTFALNNEPELDSWTGALFGDDQLHKSLENSPIIPRRVSSSTFFTPVSPVLRSSIGSKDSFTEEDDDSSSNRSRSVTMPPSSSTETFDNLIFTPVERISEENSMEVLTETEGGGAKIEEDNKEEPDGAADRISLSSNATSRSTLSENEPQLRSPVKSPTTKLKPVTEEPAKVTSIMFEVSNSDFSSTKSKRWVVLRKSVVELYKGEHERCPFRIINLGNVECNENADDDKLNIVLTNEDDGSKLCLVAPDENIRNLFINNVKKSSRSLKRQKNPRNSMTSQLMRRLGSGDRLKDMKSKKDDRLSMLLVEGDVQVIEKYEETADPSKIMSGVLMEYFDDTKSTKEKERYCWIQDGFFHIAKIVKTKPIKSIDLSTVVILDESDPVQSKYAFKLEYTISNGKRSHVFMRTLDAVLADKWMVAVSMGILYHRLTGNQKDSENKEDVRQDEFGFFPMPSERNQSQNNKTSEKVSSLRKEISEKLGREDADSLLLVHGMLDDQPDGEKDEEKKPSNIEKPTLNARLSHLDDEEDQVFNETVGNGSFEILDNIPEKENARESFRNVKGILRQQESIRRTILKNQRERRIPPPVKPKPSKLVQRKPTISSETVVHIYGSFTELSLPKLHSYAEQLELEKSMLSKNIKVINNMLSEAVVQVERDSSSETIISESEHKVLMNDLQHLQERQATVEKELKECRIHITRKVASKGMGVVSPEAGKRQSSGRSTPLLKTLSDDEDEEKSRQLRDKPGRQDIDGDHTDSIII